MEAMNHPLNQDDGEPAVEAIDAYQRRHRWLGFPLAVVYKFGDDQGPYLAALITYYGFLSLFPLLLLLVTILGFVLQGDPHLQDELLDSALAQFPVIGSQLRENVHSLTGSGTGLAVGIVGTLYGCLARPARRRTRSTARGQCPATTAKPAHRRAAQPATAARPRRGVIVDHGARRPKHRRERLRRRHRDRATHRRDSRWPCSPTSDSSCSAFRVLTASEVATRDLRVGAVGPASAGRSCRYSAPTSSPTC